MLLLCFCRRCCFRRSSPHATARSAHADFAPLACSYRLARSAGVRVPSVNTVDRSINVVSVHRSQGMRHPWSQGACTFQAGRLGSPRSCQAADSRRRGCGAAAAAAAAVMPSAHDTRTPLHPVEDVPLYSCVFACACVAFSRARLQSPAEDGRPITEAQRPLAGDRHVRHESLLCDGEQCGDADVCRRRLCDQGRQSRAEGEHISARR